MKKETLGKKLRWILVVLILLVALYVIQLNYNFLRIPLNYYRQYFPIIHSLVLKQLLTGISVGSILFIILLLIFPFFTKKIDSKDYFDGIKQGIISSFVFYVSDLAYSYFEKIGKFELFLSMVVTTVISIILIYISAKMFRKKNDSVSFRTDNISSVTAGLLFGILIQLITLGTNMLQTKVPVETIIKKLGHG